MLWIIQLCPMWRVCPYEQRLNSPVLRAVVKLQGVGP